MQITAKENIRVEISQETLFRLLSEGRVCAADFHCLDCKSKLYFQRICLQSCVPGKHCVKGRYRPQPAYRHRIYRKK